MTLKGVIAGNCSGILCLLTTENTKNTEKSAELPRILCIQWFFLSLAG